MLLLKFLQGLIIAMLLLVVVTQILVPAIQNRPLFSWFGRQRKLEKKLAQANQAKYERELIEKTRKIR